MCQIGDIILIENYKDSKNENVSRHPFIIIDDENGRYKGFNIDFIGIAMSSYKGEEHKKEVLSNICNFDVTVDDGAKKEGYVKLDVVYYFDKNKINYEVVGSVKIETFNKILQTIEVLDCRGLIKDNINNL